MKEVNYLTGLKGSKNSDPELSQKIIKDLKKKEKVNFTENPNVETSYNPVFDRINTQYKGDRKDPSTVLHESGHRLSGRRGDTRRGYYRGYKKLSDDIDTSDNLPRSIMNRIGDISTITEEANASYHASARLPRYGATKEQIKAGKKQLSNNLRTHELDSAIGLNSNEYRRAGGKLKTKARNKKNTKNKKSGN